MSPPARFDPADLQALSVIRILAEQAARAGGSAARRFFRTKLNIRLKADRTEVCDADLAAQDAVVATLRAQRPDDALISEEGASLSPLNPTGEASAAPAPANDRLTWVIDPVDGTRNFVRGIPLYACSVGAMFGGQPLVGAIYDPERDISYSATTSGGLFLNDQPLTGAESDDALAAAPVPRTIVGLPSTPKGPIAAIAHTWLGRFVSRNLGSTALHLAWIAAGQLDGALSDNAKLWDIAAGWVLVMAMGGRMTSPDGAPLFPIDVAAYTNADLPFVAGRAAVFDRLLRA